MPVAVDDCYDLAVRAEPRSGGHPDRDEDGKVHWVRDVTYDEDRSQVRTGAGADVMAALRNAAISALRLAGFTNIAPPTATTPATATGR